MQYLRNAKPVSWFEIVADWYCNFVGDLLYWPIKFKLWSTLSIGVGHLCQHMRSVSKCSRDPVVILIFVVSASHLQTFNWHYIDSTVAPMPSQSQMVHWPNEPWHRFNSSGVKLTRVASHLARSDTPSITCIVACFPAVTPQDSYDTPPTNGKAPRDPLASHSRAPAGRPQDLHEVSFHEILNSP